RADTEAAEEAAFSGAASALAQLPISGRVVIGPEESQRLAPGSDVGSGGEELDLALDPLEGRGVVARGGSGAISMIAAGPRGSLPALPDMYMRKMAVGPVARGRISLSQPISENLRSIADGFGRTGGDVTALILDRRVDRRPPPRRPLPHRQRPYTLARHVHPLQLGALRRRDPLLRPRAARGSPPARVLSRELTTPRRKRRWLGWVLLALVLLAALLWYSSQTLVPTGESAPSPADVRAHVPPLR